MHGEEVGGIGQLRDQLQLVADAALDVVRHALRPARAGGGPDPVGQRLLRRAAGLEDLAAFPVRVIRRDQHEHCAAQVTGDVVG